jgi:hypothetical protein
LPLGSYVIDWTGRAVENFVTSMKPTASFVIKRNAKAAYWIWGVCAGLLGLDISLVLSLGKENQAIYAILPTTLIVAGVLAALAWKMNRITFEISERGLEVHEPVCGKFISRELLDLDRARIVDLRSEEELRPKFKLIGTAVPGYGAGWFKLKNGEKALVFVSSESDVVHLPTRDGYSVLLSAEDNRGLLAALREGRG